MATKNQERRRLNNSVSWAMAHMETQQEWSKKHMAALYLQQSQAALKMLTLDGRKTADKEEWKELNSQLDEINNQIQQHRDRCGTVATWLSGYKLRVEDLIS